MNFGQVITAMVTPFDQKGEIDFQATNNLIEHLIDNGTDAVVVSGTTGESPTLSTDEKIQLFKFVVQQVAGRIPVIAGIGSNNTRESVQLTKTAEIIGVDGIMLVVPYYNRPSQEGIYEHFKMIANSTELPIMLYNIPGRTSCHMEVETVIRLSQIENIVSLKDATGDLEDMTEILSQTPEHFTLYSGDDPLTLPVLSIGGHGIVSVSSHIVGNEMQDMITAYKEGNITLASQYHQQLLSTFKAVFSAPSPSPIKALLNMQGINVGGVRLPLLPLNEAEMRILRKQFQVKIAHAK